MVTELLFHGDDEIIAVWALEIFFEVHSVRISSDQCEHVLNKKSHRVRFGKVRVMRLEKEGSLGGGR